MKKYTQSEGSLDVLTGRQANALNESFRRTGKYNLDDFSQEERAALDADLASAKTQDDAEIAREQERVTVEAQTHEHQDPDEPAVPDNPAIPDEPEVVQAKPDRPTDTSKKR